MESEDAVDLIKTRIRAAIQRSVDANGTDLGVIDTFGIAADALEEVAGTTGVRHPAIVSMALDAVMPSFIGRPVAEVMNEVAA